MKFSDRNLDRRILRAARGGDREGVLRLLEQGADAAACSADGAGVMLLLCLHAGRLSRRRGWRLLAVLDALVAAGADPFMADAAGDSLLWHACGQESSGQLLGWLGRYAAGQGAVFPMEARNAAGRTPLLEAVAGGNGSALTSLLANGADVHARDTAGHSVEELCPAWLLPHWRHLAELARAGGLGHWRWGVEAPDDAGEMYALLRRMRRCCADGGIAPAWRDDIIVRQLARAAFFPNPGKWLKRWQGVYGGALHVRTRYGAGVLHLVLAQALCPRTAEERTRTPRKQAAALRFLISAGADASACDRHGRTPLQQAAASRPDLAAVLRA